MLETDLKIDGEKLTKELSKLSDKEIYAKIDDAEFYLKTYKETAWNQISDRSVKEKAIKLLFLSKAFIKVGKEILEQRNYFGEK
ncbi:hypothetical protein IT568_06885 [bacterium]|nr:hypothetical protein [bacterium]